MSIVKPKNKAALKAPGDSFIEGAPDATREAGADSEISAAALLRTAEEGVASTGKPKGFRKGNKRQISLTIDDTLFDELTKLAKELRQTRTGVINLAIHQAVKRGLLKD